MKPLTKPLFVIGDIHGCLQELLQLLNYWNEEKEQLVFIGDYIDRGVDSYGVLKKVKELVETKGAWALKGNHEDLFIHANNHSTEQLCLANGGQQTLESFPTQQDGSNQTVASVKSQFPELNQFINNLPEFIETEQVVLVHAGIEPFVKNWQNFPDECLWIRESFHQNKTIDRRLIIFGHTPTSYLNKNTATHTWQNDNKLGIDGGCVFGGQLHGVRVTTTGILTDVVSIDRV